MLVSCKINVVPGTSTLTVRVEPARALIRTGSRVELHGLSATELNGLTAEVIGVKANGRLMVKLLPDRERGVAIRRENMSLCPCRLLQLDAEVIRHILYMTDAKTFDSAFRINSQLRDMLPTRLERQTNGTASVRFSERSHRVRPSGTYYHSLAKHLSAPLVGRLAQGWPIPPCDVIAKQFGQQIVALMAQELEAEDRIAPQPINATSIELTHGLWYYRATQHLPDEVIIDRSRIRVALELPGSGRKVSFELTTADISASIYIPEKPENRDPLIRNGTIRPEFAHLARPPPVTFERFTRAGFLAALSCKMYELYLGPKWVEAIKAAHKERGDDIIALMEVYPMKRNERSMVEEFQWFAYHQLPSPIEGEPPLTHLLLDAVVHDMHADVYRLALRAVPVSDTYKSDHLTCRQAADRARSHPTYIANERKRAEDRRARKERLGSEYGKTRLNPDGSVTRPWDRTD